MDTLNKAKAEISAILDAAEDREQTKKWLLEALSEQEVLIIKPVGIPSNEAFGTPTIVIGTIDATLPPFTCSATVTVTEPTEVNPNDKESVTKKVKDMLLNQAIAQGIRELIELASKYL